MPFRKIPKKFDMEEIAADLQAVLLYDGAIDPGVISRIAAELGCKPRTVYSVLDGSIKISLDFLHAAVIATGGDAEARRYLEPEGFCLTPCESSIVPDKETVSEECLDDLGKVYAFHQVLNDPKSKLIDVKRALEEAITELRENEVLWIEKNATGGAR